MFQRCDWVSNTPASARPSTIPESLSRCLEMINGRHTIKRLQVQLPDATDLQFLFSHLKHGRSRQRKKAATILARKRSIPNSVIAQALQSSCSTTRRYYRIYLDAGLEALFAWSTNRHCGDQRKVS